MPTPSLLPAAAAAALTPARLRARRVLTWMRAHRMLAALLILLTVDVLWQFGGAAAAQAQTAAEGGESGSAFLDAFGVTDSQGRSIGGYRLRLVVDAGVVPGAGDAVNAAVATLAAVMWTLYIVWVSIALWFLDTALQYRILGILRPVANLVAEALEQTIGQLGLVPILMTISFIAMVIWIIRGRAGAGALDFVLSLLASALLSSVLANPVNMVTGDNGLMVGARDLGIATSNQIVTGGEQTDADSDTLRRRTTGMLTDHFVRTPHQLINYGDVIPEGSTCATVYDESIATGGESEDIVNSMGECKESYKATAGDPMQALVGIAVVIPSGGLMQVLSLLIALILLFFNLSAIYLAMKNVIEILKAILPGAAKGGVIRAMVNLFMVAASTVLLLIGVGVFILFVEAIFAGRKEAGLGVVEVFMLLDMIMLCAIIALLVFWWKSHRAGKTLGEKVQSSLTPQPVSPPSRDGARATAMVGAKGASAASAISHRAAGLANARSMNNAMNQGQGQGQGQGGPGAPPQRRPHLATSLAKGVGKGSVQAAKIGAMSTVGAPVYAPRAAKRVGKAATAASRHVRSSLDQAKQRGQQRVGKAAGDAKAFGHEYVHNLGVAGRFLGKATGIPQATSWAAGQGRRPAATSTAAAAMMLAPSTTKPHNPQPESSFRAAGRSPHLGDATRAVRETLADAGQSTGAGGRGVGAPADPAATSRPRPTSVDGLGARPLPSQESREEQRAQVEQLMERMRQRQGRTPPPTRLPRAVGDD